MKNSVPESFAHHSPAVRVPKAAELVAAAVRRQIVRGQLPVGSVMPAEAALMDLYGVSRPTLREALRILESEGLLAVKRGAHGGARVQQPDVAIVGRYAGLLLQVRDTTVADVVGARHALEPAVVRWLAERAEPLVAGALAAALHEEERSGRDAGFHQRLVEIGGNNTLALFSAMLVEILARHALASGADRTVWDALADEPGACHAGVVELVTAADASAAERLWHRHTGVAVDRVVALLGDTRVADLLD